MNMYTFELKRLFKQFLIWSIVTTLLITLFLSFFPSMASSGMAELVHAKINAIPPAMREALGISDIVDFSDMLQYFAYVLQFIFIATCIYSSILGASALIKEESEGTIEFLYAKPISRVKIVTVKLLSTYTVLFLLNFILYVVTVIFTEAFKSSGYVYMPMLQMIFIGMFLVQTAFWAVGLALSTIIKKYSQAVPVALGVFFVTYIIGAFAMIVEDLKWLQYASPFYYAVPLTLLENNGNINIEKLIIITILIIGSILITYTIYRRKDLLV